MAVSVAQEFYKVRNEWARIDPLKSWKLAVWVAQFMDVDIIDKFMETERTAAGAFDDIFFRFDSEYHGDNELYEAALWKEYVEWFATPPQEKYDMYKALKNDGLLEKDYKPDTALQPTFQNLVKEFLRFKACIPAVKNTNFCIYFPPGRTDLPGRSNWLNKILKEGVPDGIRLATIDYAAKPQLIIDSKHMWQVAELHAQLQMAEAISNEMDKGGGAHDTVGVDERFRKQIRVVMDTTVKKDPALTEKEISLLLHLSRQMGSASARISGLLIAAQALFSIEQYDKSEFYADDAIKQSTVLKNENDPAGYSTWKACMMLKGALLIGKKKRTEAIEVYEQMALEASSRGDAFFAMEGYRISGQLYYENNQNNKAFETLLLSLVAGSYMEQRMRRESTFLHAAYLALYTGRLARTDEEVKVVEEQLQNWLGNDWKELLPEDTIEKVKLKTKKRTSVLD